MRRGGSLCSNRLHAGNQLFVEPFGEPQALECNGRACPRRALRINLMLLLTELDDQYMPRPDKTTCQNRRSDDEHGEERQCTRQRVPAWPQKIYHDD